MNTPSLTSFESQVFESSKDSQLAKAIKWIWLAVLISAVYLEATNRGSLTGLCVGIGISCVLMGAVHLTLRSQLSKKRTRVAIDATEISCLAFDGPIKKYALLHVSSASIEVAGAGSVLQLQLNTASGTVDKKSFINGRNPARPYFSLAPYSTEDQEKMLDAINARVGLKQFDEVKSSSANPLRIEREFQEKLKATVPRTWATFGLAAANIAIWGAMVAMGVDALKPSSEMLFQWGGNTAFGIQNGQWWRLLSATFLHAGVIHLAINMLGLVVVGMTLERLLGHKLYLLVYLISGAGGSALSMHFSAQKAVSVGASGAIFGIAGALLVTVFKHRKTLPKMFSKQTLSGMGFFVVYSLAQGFGRTGTDNAAHVGGLIGGCLMAALLSQRLDLPVSSGRDRWRTPVVVLSVAVLTIGLALSSKNSDFDVQRAIDGNTAFSAGMAALDAAQAAIKQEQRDVNAGKLTKREADNRSRTLHAPDFRKISDQLSSAWFLPGDYRNDLLKDIRYAVALMTEALAMESNFPEGSEQIEPVDPVRRAFLDDELIKTNVRLEALSKKIASEKAAVNSR